VKDELERTWKGALVGCFSIRPTTPEPDWRVCEEIRISQPLSSVPGSRFKLWYRTIRNRTNRLWLSSQYSELF